ncbi:MAG TPA: papain-like cysteine protease family protein [Planctomycetota bacterium]|nr:papain-like cysteine protease family protein [Planctomycetota bacterium]
MRYDVPLIPQPTTMSCWAASIAMIRSWHEQMSYDPAGIAANHGGLSYMFQFHHSLNPNDVYILQRNGFTVAAAQCYANTSPVVSMLQQYGPLWVATAAPAPHIRVVTGLSGQNVYINDPAPVNSGATYRRDFRAFFGQMETLAGQEMGQPAPVYIAHLSRL